MFTVFVMRGLYSNLHIFSNHNRFIKLLVYALELSIFVFYLYSYILDCFHDRAL